MKILLLRQYNPYVENGASANRFRGLIDGLCLEGNDVTLAIVGGLLSNNEATIFISPQKQLRVEYLTCSNHHNYLMKRLNNYLLDNSVHLLAIRRRFRKLLKQKYDIIWLTNNSTVFSLYGKERSRITGRTFIELNEFNDIYKNVGVNKKVLQRFKSDKDNRLFLDTIGGIDLFGVMTKTLISHYQSLAKPDAKFLHLPMTVDLSRFNNITDTDAFVKPYIGYTGVLSNQKDGVDVLIKAFARVADKYPSLQLCLAGFYSYDVPVQEKLIADFGLQERIHYIGTLKRDQIPPFICNASVLVLSRPDSHQAQGGFPTKLGEYLATGNPVCVTKVGEIPDYLEDNVSAFMAEPGDVDSFANALDRALCDEANAKRVGANGRKVAEENFDAEKQAKRLLQFLKDNLK